jgi:hypothetical protein
MRPVPDSLRDRPFSRTEALALGVTSRMLHGSRFVRILPTVYRCRTHDMSDDDWVTAARLALPGTARMTGITRIQQLGLDFGSRLPVRFVVQGDLHLAFDEIFLHRTALLPPTDDVGVTPAAAFIAYCRRARVVDAVKVGDWLLHHAHMSLSEVHDLALAQQWRDGADEALWVLELLDGDARSLPESETRVVLELSGLPRPCVNRSLVLDDDVHLIGDLVYDRWRTVVEYEGSHHQQDRAQYLTDLDRYAVMRRHDVGYVQVTRERLRHARTLVGEVHRELVSRGYDGPPPRFDGRWRLLFCRITDIIASDRVRHRRRGGLRTVR